MEKHTIKLSRPQAEMLTWELRNAVLNALPRSLEDKIFVALMALASERLADKQPQFLPRDAKPHIKVSFDKAQSIALLLAYERGLVGQSPLTRAMLIQQLAPIDRQMA